MERFVIGAAIVAAFAIAAAGALGGAITMGDHFSFSLADDSGGGGGEPVTGTPSAFAATSLKVENATLVLRVAPEDRADILVSVSNTGPLALPRVRLEGDKLVIDGGQDRSARGCGVKNGAFSARTPKDGHLQEGQLPIVTVRTPRDVDLAVSGAVKTIVGAAHTADLSIATCGPTEIGPVAEELDLSLAGSGDVTVASAGLADLSLSGAGDASIGPIRGGLDLALAGSGDVTVDSASGPLDISVAGSGATAVNGGTFAMADISIAGSGDVLVRGDVGQLKASLAGSGDIAVTGTVETVDASIMGSGDVSVGAVNGRVSKSVMGSGSVRVGPSGSFK
jgi:hypothetical protein